MWLLFRLIYLKDHFAWGPSGTFHGFWRNLTWHFCCVSTKTFKFHLRAILLKQKGGKCQSAPPGERTLQHAPITGRDVSLTAGCTIFLGNLAVTEAKKFPLFRAQKVLRCIQKTQPLNHIPPSLWLILPFTPTSPYGFPIKSLSAVLVSSFTYSPYGTQLWSRYVVSSLPQ
jgi:hypothetical protein